MTDPDYGPNLGHPMDPRNDDDDSRTLCERCEGQGCCRCGWSGSIEHEEVES